jgi:hypothetical protein
LKLWQAQSLNLSTISVDNPVEERDPELLFSGNSKVMTVLPDFPSIAQPIEIKTKTL